MDKLVFCEAVDETCCAQALKGWPISRSLPGEPTVFLSFLEEVFHVVFMLVTILSLKLKFVFNCPLRILK